MMLARYTVLTLSLSNSTNVGGTLPIQLTLTISHVSPFWLLSTIKATIQQLRAVLRNSRSSSGPFRYLPLALLRVEWQLASTRSVGTRTLISDTSTIITLNQHLWHGRST